MKTLFSKSRFIFTILNFILLHSKLVSSAKMEDLRTPYSANMANSVMSILWAMRNLLNVQFIGGANAWFYEVKFKGITFFLSKDNGSTMFSGEVGFRSCLQLIE